MKSQTTWYLQQIGLFKGLTSDDLHHISSCFHDRSYLKGSNVKGLEKPETIFLLKKGVIELYTISEEGKKVIIDVLGVGSIFGNHPHNDDFELYARVKRPCLICQTKTKDFFEMVSKYPQVSVRLLHALHQNIVSKKEQISSLAAESVEQRFLRLIKMISGRFKKEQIVFTHEELAQMIGTSRQTVSSLISTLVKEGKLEKKDRKYELVMS